MHNTHMILNRFMRFSVEGGTGHLPVLTDTRKDSSNGYQRKWGKLHRSTLAARFTDGNRWGTLLCSSNWIWDHVEHVSQLYGGSIVSPSGSKTDTVPTCRGNSLGVRVTTAVLNNWWQNTCFLNNWWQNTCLLNNWWQNTCLLNKFLHLPLRLSPANTNDIRWCHSTDSQGQCNFQTENIFPSSKI
jgi:hypothetical protein